MTEGTKNTVVGVLLTAILGMVFTGVSLSFDNGRHLAKIDTVLEQQKDMLVEFKKSASSIPPQVENKLEELRWRLNSFETRMNKIDGTEDKK